ncbi:alkylhydroperoxidase [Cupriavidus sp. USMAA2-4]|uniref:Alkylhydroperoxidase n=1 Tax=Cupriavidus malaysiensis TaxID=367825 RepID=A0A1D9HX88_9BURK|nr:MULTISPECIES: carboxymuconolactone decarboxylase family protein [Cupriavidus]AOY92396.1 alkylhydroperoxidase [Cupriavidus sp. USMAA2-4]AOY98021.1 alkylhydroperoxidase [Cupriavidus sp. USMAHM13]AOZ04449.1 alkylhydroperoxidase [Cupriavidus malaysiensis]
MPQHSVRLAYQEFAQAAPAVHAALAALGKAVDDSGLDKALTELVKLRVSQINGCAFCLQYHLNIVRQLGLDLDPRKLDLLAAWRDAGLYSEREQAALAWAEALTRVAVHEVDDAVYAQASAAFAPAELAHLSAAVANINAWNRIAAGFRFAPPPAVRGSAA